MNLFAVKAILILIRCVFFFFYKEMRKNLFSVSNNSR